MTSRTSYVSVTDLFCGAGGSSLGATLAGAEVRLAMNHWHLAIETHNTNFPHVDHHCADISRSDPRYYPPTDILVATPECTNHSLANGKMRIYQRQLQLFGQVAIDPAEERSRATMWDVPRFAEAHRYRAVIVENVVEARQWVQFPAWLQAMELLGYRHQIVYLNSMFAHPTPQSRDRMYVIFTQRSLRVPDLDICPAARCAACGVDVGAVQSWKRPDRPWGKYGPQYVYRCPRCAAEVVPYYFCAATAIDWGLPAPRIGDRAKPLKEKTLRRIQIGLERFGRQALLVGNYSPGTHSTSLDRAAPTQTSRQTQALVVPPFLVSLNHSDVARSRAATEPMPTAMPQGNPGVVVPPIVVKFRGDEVGQPLDHALSTVTAGGIHHGVVVPPAFLTSYHTTDRGTGISEPVPTQDTRDRHGLVVPPFVVSYYTRVSGQQAAVSGCDEALPTVPGRAVHYLAQPGETPAVEDCGFRMLQPHEIGRVMAFPSDYTVLGTQREKVKQYGNAVTPPVMRMLFERVLAVLD